MSRTDILLGLCLAGIAYLIVEPFVGSDYDLDRWSVAMDRWESQ